MKNSFALLQKIGRSFMLPIAVLPMAGILLGLGAAFTSPALIETYNLTFLADGSILNRILVLMFRAGNLIFSNLPVIFAVGIAIGMADKNKETAALSALIGFLLFHTTINVVLQFKNITADNTSIEYLVSQGFSNSDAAGISALYTKELGIFTLQTGVFGGIVCGLFSAFITNRFSNQVLPDYLAFFSGNRFVAVMTMILFIPLAFIFPFIWPSIFKVIVEAGKLFAATGAIGNFFYGFCHRMLNIFGLHHAIYPLFWYTELGGVMEVGGKLVSGGQRIFFAQLADPTVKHFSAEATRTMTGAFLPMMFGLPAAALAMYHVASPENKSKAKGILMSAALTSFLTGITEPIEFTFLFVAPVLYIIHAILEGIAYMVLYILNVAVGITFSRGLIDFIFFGVLQGTSKTSYQWILILGPIYSIIYYFLFKFLILKFNFATPGREGSDVKLYRRTDYNNKNAKNESNNIEVDNKEDGKEIIDHIVDALGGVDNIENIDACITRLRVTVKDESKVADDETWTKLEAKKVIRMGKGIQAIYGTQADVYKNLIKQKYNI